MKIKVLSAVVVLIIVTIFIVYSLQEAAPEVSIQTSESAIEPTNAISSNDALEHKAIIASASFSSAQAIPKLNENDAANKLAELEYLESEWNHDRGYFTKEDLEAYANYDADALFQLGQGGDLKALDVLATQLLKVNKRGEAVRIYAFAALHGSTKAMRNLSALNLAAIRRGDVADEDKLGYFKTMLVHSEVAAMRGDRQGIWSNLQTLVFEKAVLSAEDIAEVSKRAKQQFDGLVQARDAAGLSEFDHSENLYIALRMDMSLPVIPNPNNWALDYMAAKK